MSIDKIGSGFQDIRLVKTPQTPRQIQGQATEAGGKGKSTNFGDMFVDAIKEVDQMQKDADKQIEGMVLGKGVTPHDAMIALEKADIAFQLMNQIRGKIVRAYEEVMRTQF